MIHRPGKLGWLERNLLAFFLLAALSLVVIFIVDPSLYLTKLLLTPSPINPYPLPVTLFLKRKKPVEDIPQTPRV